MTYRDFAKIKKKQKEIRKSLPDLSFAYGFAGLKKIPFEKMPKDKSISLRLSSELLETLKEKAEEDGLDYQKWIRHAIEEALGPKAFKKEF